MHCRSPVSTRLLARRLAAAAAWSVMNAAAIFGGDAANANAIARDKV
jgi:hypothetical protein